MAEIQVTERCQAPYAGGEICQFVPRQVELPDVLQGFQNVA